jgi:hypothetical protein
MKQTKLILTRTALVLFVLLMAQSAWGATYFYKLAGCKVTLTAGDQEVTLSANQDGLTGGLSMVYTGKELKPTVVVECEQFKNNEHNSQGYKDVTGMFDVNYSNNLYATESAAADGDPTITLTLKAANAASFSDADAGAQVVKYFFIETAAGVSFSAEPLVTEREYNGKPWTIADLKINGVPEGHTFTGVEATFDSEDATTPGFVGTYTYALNIDNVQIFLDGTDVTDCFEGPAYEESTSQMEITPKEIYIRAYNQSIFEGQDIVTGTSQVQICKKDEANYLVPTTLAEGDVLTGISLSVKENQEDEDDVEVITAPAGTYYIIPYGAKIYNGETDVKGNYTIIHNDDCDGILTISDNTVIITITGHTGTFVYDGEEHTVSGYECAISYAETPLDANVITPEMIVYNGTASVSGTTVDDSDVMGLDAEEFGLSGYTGALEPHFVVAADGSITITPAKVTVAIVGAKLSLAYNGDEQEVSGYTATADNAIYDVNSYIDYIGEGYEPTVAATHAGKYWMEISAEDFENNNENFEVFFMVPDDGDGYLEILPINAKVTIKGKTKTAVYDGEEKTVTGWKATANTDLYDVTADFKYYGQVDEAGNAYATLTHVLVDDETGEVLKEYMGLDAAYFANVNPDFATVEFVVTDGWLEITKRPVTITITGETAKYEYDAVEHVIEGAVIDISDELYEEEYADAEEIFYAPKEGSASETATAKRTEIGITYMGMKVEDWENFNTDYDVTFEVTDGSVTISYHVASLADDTDNTSTIADIVADYKGMADVTLADRTLYKDGSWNTICLPFDVDIEDSPLAGADVRQLTGASYEEGTLTLEFTAVTEIKAGEPYIIKWEEGNDLVNPVFKGVEVVAGLSEARFDIGEEMALTFKGTYAPVKYTSENKSILLVGDNSALYYPQAGAFTNPQRAFFELEGIEVGDVESNAIGLRLDGATRINMQTTASDAVYYDLSGRRVNGQPAEAGIYIVNGQKVMIK